MHHRATRVMEFPRKALHYERFLEKKFWEVLLILPRTQILEEFFISWMVHNSGIIHPTMRQRNMWPVVHKILAVDMNRAQNTYRFWINSV